jgi:hypothetical protein
VHAAADGTPVTVRESTDVPDETRSASSSPVAPTNPHARPQHVDTVLETWRIDDEWWRTPIARRYVEVVLEDGAHVVLFEDLTTGAWFAQKP